MLMPIFLLGLGLVFLIKGGDWFVDGAAGIAEKFRVPDLLIGATVVSIGTTLPEVMVSSNSALSGHGEIAYGNAIGSIICNTSLIAAITVAIKPAPIEKKALKVPVIFFFISAAIYVIIAYTTGSFTRPAGLCFLVIFIIYMVILIKQALAASSGATSGESSGATSGASLETGDGNINKEETEQEQAVNLAEADGDSADKKEKPMGLLFALLVIGAVLIAVGADLLVDNGTLIAEGFGVPESVIALTFVALGTSLPELVTAITSLIKGHGALSLGNICGANLFNIVLVSGLSMTLGPFDLPAGKMINIGGTARNASLVVDTPVMLAVMIILTVPALIKGKLERWQGILLLIIYTSFTAFQLIN